jgi:DNA-directed RNA polymerase subunit RPC12/RpoP
MWECPRCSRTNVTPGIEDGQVVRCAYCDQQVMVEAPRLGRMVATEYEPGAWDAVLEDTDE